MRRLEQVIVEPPPSPERAMRWLAISLTVLALAQMLLLILRMVTL